MNAAPARDRRLLCVAAFLRAVATGAVGVFGAIHLGAMGLGLGAIGLVIGAGMTGSALTTLAVGARADLALGRRRLVVLLGALGTAGLVALALPLPFWILLPAAFIGTVNLMGRDRGGLSALEQALLPETTTDAGRTWALARYNIALDAGHALGALAGATPALLGSAFLFAPAEAYRLSILGCAGLLAAGVVLYGGLSPAIERTAPRDAPVPPVSPATRRSIRRIAWLFGLDSIGGGFLSSALIAYWFFERYGLSESDIALIFFGARVLNALSHLGAAWLARRIGLVNTMVWTHVPSSLFLMAVPAAPGAGLAAGLFLAREGLVEMDVPTRQSYVLAIVRPEERSYASGVTNLARSLGWAAGPLVAGFVMQHLALAGPLFIGGGLKIAYDLLLFRAFRRIRPPEEA